MAGEYLVCRNYYCSYIMNNDQVTYVNDTIDNVHYVLINKLSKSM